MSEKEKKLENGELLSIGTISRLSGAHIKSLRYYDRLGILKPAYTDLHTGYRYYTFSQLSVIDAIKICVELDIPLKDFNHFIDKDGGRIHYKELMEYGREIAEKKRKIIEEGLDFIYETQKEIERAALYKEPEQRIRCRLPERRWFLETWEGKNAGEKYDDGFTRLMLEAVGQGFSLGYEVGLAHFYHKGKREAYQFIEVQGEGKGSCKNFLQVSEGDYLCRQTKRGGIEKIRENFQEIDWASYEGIVVETELFTGEFNFKRPVYELQCLLPD